MPLILPNWCPVNWKSPGLGTVGPLYNEPGNELLDPLILYAGNPGPCVLPCNPSYWQIIGGQGPDGSGPVVPADSEVQVRGGGGNPLGRLYGTVTATYTVRYTATVVFYAIWGTVNVFGLGPRFIYMWPPEGAPLGVPYTTSDPGFGALLAAFEAQLVVQQTIAGDAVIVTTPGANQYLWDLNYEHGSLQVIDVDAGQSFLLLGDAKSLLAAGTIGHDDLVAIGADSTQFGRIYTSYFPLPSGDFYGPG